MKELRRFVMRKDEDFGITGFVPEGSPMHFNSASEGGIVAHDAIEHIKGDTSWQGELIALGQMLYIRGEGEYWSNYTQQVTLDVAKHMSSDFLHFLPIEGWFVPDPGRTTRLDDDIEATIDRMFADLRRSIPYEFDPEDDDRAPKAGQVDTACERIRGWLRKGYRVAVRRFHGASAYQVADLFARIEREASDAIKQAGEELYYRLDIRYDTKTLKHSVVLVEAFEEDY